MLQTYGSGGPVQNFTLQALRFFQFFPVLHVREKSFVKLWLVDCVIIEHPVIEDSGEDRYMSRKPPRC